MKIKKYISQIKNLDACSEALKNALNYQTSQELWDDCKRGDWMLWLIGKLSGEPECDKRKKLVLTACKCARLALPFVKKGDVRPLKAIETVEKWTRGEATIEQVRAATYAAGAAAYAAGAAAGAAAGGAAGGAAGYAAGAAAYAAAGAAAGGAAGEDAAYAKVIAQFADIVRENYPEVDSLWD